MSEEVLIPDGLVHVGWFCHHGPAEYNRETREYEREAPHRNWHRKKNGDWKAKKSPGTISSVSTRNYWEPSERACPLAVPMFISETSPAAANLLAERP